MIISNFALGEKEAEEIHKQGGILALVPLLSQDSNQSELIQESAGKSRSILFYHRGYDVLNARIHLHLIYFLHISKTCLYLSAHIVISLSLCRYKYWLWVTLLAMKHAEMEY